MQPTSLQDLESTLQKLESKKDEWANLTTLKRAELLRKTLACVLEVRAEAWECCNHPRAQLSWQTPLRYLNASHQRAS